MIYRMGGIRLIEDDMTKRADRPTFPRRVPTLQEAAELGELALQQLARIPSAEVWEIVKILADCGHGGCESKMWERDFGQQPT